MNHLTIEVTTDDFRTQVLESQLPVLVEFTADWCPPCKMLAPILDEIAIQYDGKLRVAAVDSDTNPALSIQYGVMGLPTMLLFVNGELTERMIGFTPRPRIESKLLPHLVMDNV